MTSLFRVNSGWYPGGTITGAPTLRRMMVYQLAMSVRDYECDMQGVVNNAVYQNYLEHARHEFLKTKGLDFAALTGAGNSVMRSRPA